jgi:hypothetical protein
MSELPELHICVCVCVCLCVTCMVFFMTVVKRMLFILKKYEYFSGNIIVVGGNLCFTGLLVYVLVTY